MGSSEGSLNRWSKLEGPWQLVLSLLDPIKRTPDTMEKVLWEVRETLEWPSTCSAVGAMGWVFLSALQAEMEAAV